MKPMKVDFESIVRFPEPGERPDQSFRFGSHVVIPAARLLLVDGVPVCIGGRAFDLLVVLLRHRGAVVGKEEIMRQVWPTTIVDDSNLRFQMASLRKVLDDDRDYIKTIPGRGYLLAGDVPCADLTQLPVQGVEHWDSGATGDQAALLNALCSVLSALGRNPDSAASVKALLSG